METIYTIPVNEAFDRCAAEEKPLCPFCDLYRTLQENELDLILGASMMEPDVRIKTNEQGFCRRHYEEMMKRKNRLSLALMLQSHLDAVRHDAKQGFLADKFRGPGAAAVSRADKLDHSCYICGRIAFSLDKMIENAAALWAADPTFRKKLKAQKMFCLPHFAALAEAAKNVMQKKQFADFYPDLEGVTFTYFDALREDVDLFCKKFDYRYEELPWGTAKDAVERAAAFLAPQD